MSESAGAMDPGAVAGAVAGESASEPRRLVLGSDDSETSHEEEDEDAAEIVFDPPLLARQETPEPRSSATEAATATTATAPAKAEPSGLKSPGPEPALARQSATPATQDSHDNEDEGRPESPPGDAYESWISRPAPFPGRASNDLAPPLPQRLWRVPSGPERRPEAMRASGLRRDRLHASENLPRYIGAPSTRPGRDAQTQTQTDADADPVAPEAGGPHGLRPALRSRRDATGIPACAAPLDQNSRTVLALQFAADIAVMAIIVYELPTWAGLLLLALIVVVDYNPRGAPLRFLENVATFQWQRQRDRARRARLGAGFWA